MRHAARLLPLLLLLSSCAHIRGGDASRITEIMLERTGCSDPCRAYRAVLKRDGTMVLENNEHGPAPGTWKASIEPALFEELARFLVREGYPELRGEYGQPWMHTGPVRTAVVLDGKRMTVTHYPTTITGPKPPIRLSWIEAAIDAVLERAEEVEKVSDELYRPE